MNEILAAFLSKHLGIITRRDAIQLGLTSRQFDGLVARGELVRVFSGVYRHAAAVTTAEQRLYAGLCAVGERGYVSHRSALGYHGVRNFACDLVELSTTAQGLPRHRGILVHRTARVDRADVMRRGLIVVSRPARTVIDAARVMSASLVVRFAQEWMASKLLRPDDLEQALARHPARRRLNELTKLLRDADIGEADTVAEALLGEILTRAGVPPVLHHLVTTIDGNTYELDWAYPDARVGLELDGYGVHLRSFRAFDSDRLRRNELTVNGWRILNFTRRICRDRPSVVVAQVRGALEESRFHP